MRLLGIFRNVGEVCVKTGKVYESQSRGFMRLLTSITNRPDHERIKAIGPDRSCAEWLLRCGASMRWMGQETFVTDFNRLPSGEMQSNVIEAIEAVEAGIMDVGFDHFDGCKHIRRVRFHHLPYFDDEALQLLIDKLKHSLEYLELTSCGDITDRGLTSITQLELLKTLILQDLPEVRNKDKCYKTLKDGLPSCDITYKDLK
jgi:H+-transporting ATP synthase F0 complex subunit s